ncbi:phosphatase PAP2 family protein [Catenulispora pinisilvae]|uniref:phosphatase PAP2 family protein n=1 Tax=Catenulispora pinisilvae TaxID=2705253 RepID=UPI0018919EE6|nr:phosphatase PAP2 family protein [Catenulispora pinisilvae]
MFYPEALAVDRHTATVGSRRDLRNRLVAGALVAVAGVFVVYLLAVRTRWGQDFENAALAGAREHRSGSWYGDADRWLNRLTAESFGVSLVVIGAVGLLRRRLLLALCGVLTAGGAVVAARFLKATLPSRPALGAEAAGAAQAARAAHVTAANLVRANAATPAGVVKAASMAAHAAVTARAAAASHVAAASHTALTPYQAPNTLPSGHTAAAMGLFFAALIVVSRRWYVPVTVLALPGAAFAGVATVAADWHRVSDTVAADLLALAVGLLGLAVAAQIGLVRPGPAVSRSSPGQRLLYAVLLIVATAALAVGAAYFVRYHGATSELARNNAAYWAAQAFALGAALAAAGAMLAVCRNLESVGRRPPRGLTIQAP